MKQTYLIKGMANISGDVVINFWIENQGKKLTSGSDTIYLGSFEEKIKTKVYIAKSNSKLIYFDLLNYIKSYSTSNKFAEIPKEIRNGPKKLKIEFLGYLIK